MKLSNVVVAIGIVGLIGGCTSSQAASPSTSPVTMPSAPSPSATASPTPTATPTPTARPSATTPADVGLAPAGRWTSIQWIDAGRGFPTLAKTPSEAHSMTLYGWSHGFVAFGSDGGQGGEPARPPALVSTSSPDGLHWSTPRPIDVSGSRDQIDIAQVVEGPAGLLAVGRYPADTCGGPPVIAGLWHSTDGASWRAVALPRSMVRGHVETLDGGSAGYIATGKQSDGKTAGIWLSQNATTWQATALPKPTSGTLVVTGATSFAGGLVVAGAVIGEEGCGGPQSIHPAAWWSADGSSWTRESLPGASTAAGASLSIHRLNDREIVAVSLAGDTPDAWTSTDGRTWSAVSSPTDEALYGAVADDRRSIIVAAPSDDVGPLTFKTVGAQLEVAELPQMDGGPTMTPDTIPTITAVGPTGLVVVSVDGSHLWLGVPSGS
ncbi:MAG TPA: hypothetical protein VFY18_06130 [Candidatus Limnocylindrales bacterium]|nr:hypothetical protein [Candidatus Limnocylindrales bacterium]